MRRGTSENNKWSNSRPDIWSVQPQRFSRVNTRPNYHGFNQRAPGPRHWRPEPSGNNFRPRNPPWSGSNFKSPLLRLPSSDCVPQLIARPPSHNRVPWMDDNQHTPPSLPQYPTTAPQYSQKDSYGLTGEQNLHETINTVKQKLRERKMSSDVQTECLSDSQAENINSYKSERRRIEHTKVIKPILVKKSSKRRDGHANKPKPSGNQLHSLTDSYKRKADIMRKKILKQLFKLDKDKLRNLLNQSEPSTKYNVALNSLIKETRGAISREIRNAAEKSLQNNTKMNNVDRGGEMVHDEFLGHLGTMLDTDATLELSTMEPQIIAQLSKVLQADLMGSFNDDLSVRNLASAMTEDYGNDYEYAYENSLEANSNLQYNQENNVDSYMKSEHYPDEDSKYYPDAADGYRAFSHDSDYKSVMKIDPYSNDLRSDESHLCNRRSFSYNSQDSSENKEKHTHQNDTNFTLKSPVDFISPVSDEDFRTLLPQNINLENISKMQETSMELLKNKEENDSANFSKENASNDHERNCDMITDLESQEILHTSDTSITIRKDLFTKVRGDEIDNTVNEIESDPKRRSIACQTDKICVKVQGIQYYVKKVDASSQIYESLFTSKSKGTQTLNENLKDRSCQTLKLDGLSSLALCNDSQSTVTVETQTGEVFNCEKADFKDAEVTCNLIEDSKAVKKPSVNISKSEEAMERMKAIDNQIMELMNEKLSLYSFFNFSEKVLDLPGKKTESLNTNKHNTYHIPIIRNKLKNNNETTKKSDKRNSFSKQIDNTSRYGRNRERERHDSVGKHVKSNIRPKANLDSDKSLKTPTPPLVRSHSRQKSKEDDYLKHERRSSVGSSKKIKSDSVKSVSYNLVPCKDISNCSDTRDDSSSFNIDSDEQSLKLSNLDSNVESMYIEATGVPVPMDCDFVVSEEVVVNSESNESILTRDKIVNTPDVDKSQLRNKHKRTRSSNSSSGSKFKSDCDTIAVKNKLPHIASKTVPPLKIKKHLVSDGKSISSPLYNLISRMKDSDEENDEDTLNTSHVSKDITNLLSEDGLDSNHNHSQNLENHIKMLDCFVQLEQLDLSKISEMLKVNSDSSNMNDFNDPCTSFIDDIDSTILNNDALFSDKNYENDDDCLLQTNSFGNFDADPGIIDNIVVEETFDMIDQWDSKLFENVSLLEEREILQDKNLLESIAPNETDLKTSEETEEDDEDVSVETVDFTKLKKTIVTLTCVGSCFLAASQDGYVYYNSISGKQHCTIKACDTPITGIILKEKTTCFYTGSHDGVLRCFDYKNGKKALDDIQVMCGPIQCMYQQWKTLYIGTQTGFIVQFDISSSALQTEEPIQFSENAILALHAMKEGARKVLLIASRSQDVVVKDAKTGLLLRSFKGPNSTIYSLLFDSGLVYCGNSGPSVQIFDFVSGELVGYHTGGRGAVCLKKHKGLIFTGCYDGVIYVYTKGNEKPVAKIPGPGKMLLALAIVKNKIIAACNDKKLSVYPIPKDVVKLFKA